MDLEGITVLDFTHLLPGPYATQLLVDAGAEVIKVEPPEGDPARRLEFAPGRPGTLFALLNRGKRSVTLDLKADGVDEVLEPLFGAADVVIEQYRPGVAERLGIGEPAVREVSPDVVYCSLTGYGRTGPKRDHAGHDLLYVGEAGLLDMNRSGPEERPVVPGFQLADIAGGLVAAFGIVSALLSRELGTSEGESLDVSMTEAALSFGQVLASSALFGGDPRPGEAPLAGDQPWYGTYETADGKYVAVAALEPEFWSELCEVLEHEALVEKHMSEDRAIRRAVRETLEETFASRTRDEWVEMFGDRDVMAGPVRPIGEALDSPLFESRNAIYPGDSDTPPRLGFPAKADVRPRTSSPPDVGEDTAAVLTDVGVDTATCEKLAAAGAFGDRGDVVPTDTDEPVG